MIYIMFYILIVFNIITVFIDSSKTLGYSQQGNQQSHHWETHSYHWKQWQSNPGFGSNVQSGNTYKLHNTASNNERQQNSGYHTGYGSNVQPHRPTSFIAQPVNPNKGHNTVSNNERQRNNQNGLVYTTTANPIQLNFDQQAINTRTAPRDVIEKQIFNDVPDEKKKSQIRNEDKIGDIDDRPVWGSVSNINNPDNQYPITSTRSTLTILKPKPYSGGSISVLKCREYCNMNIVGITSEVYFLPAVFPRSRRAVLKPGQVKTFVVGGEDSLKNEFPHMAAIGFGDPKGTVSWNNCAGVLISDFFVMTAAHCTDSIGTPTVVRLGALDVNTVLRAVIDIEIAEVIVHPNYKLDQSLYNDIALLRLKDKVEFSEAIKPACLYDEPDLRGVSSAVATGWGTIGFADAPSDILQKVKLDIISNTKCRQLYAPKTNVSPNGIISSQICAGILAGGHDTCTGDSGGPLQINNTRTFRYDGICPMEIIGITSYGEFCAEENSPGVYTRVSDFTPWIEKIVWSR